MKHKSIEEIAKRMAGIDIAILSNHTENGQIANRPMSNNGDVKYDGTSYYFTFEQSRTVADIRANPRSALGFTSEGGNIFRRHLRRSGRQRRIDPGQRPHSKLTGPAISIVV